jgi:SHS2 domain-containing protein
MREHEILKDGKQIRVRVLASTRAGLVGAAIQGLFEAKSPKYAESEEKAKTVERPFEVKADGFNSLLIAILNEALRQSESNHEAYEEIRLSLIIDNQATGEFIGRAVKGYGNPVKAVERLGLEVEKNERGHWETIIVLSS